MERKMLKKSILTLAGFALFFASTAYAGVSIQHRYLGETPSGDQTVVSLEVSVTNTGTGDLTGVELIATGPIYVPAASTHALSVGALTAGTTATANWDLPTGASPQIGAMLSGDLYVSVVATDGSGSTVVSNATSIAGGAE
jgi:hypothetical protein